MKRFLKSFLLLCGLSLTLAAFPVCGQTAASEIVINKKPLKDFAASVKAKYLDWSKPFAVEAETVLTNDGKFDREKTKFTRAEGDAELTEAVKQAFEAIGESGWFGYLSRLGNVKDVRLSAAQTAETFAFSVIFEQPTREKANTLSSGINGIVNAALLLDKNGAKRLGDDERKLLSGTRVTAAEKNVSINISLPAQDFQEMARREMSKEKTAE